MASVCLFESVSCDGPRAPKYRRRRPAVELGRAARLHLSQAPTEAGEPPSAPQLPGRDTEAARARALRRYSASGHLAPGSRACRRFARGGANIRMAARPPQYSSSRLVGRPAGSLCYTLAALRASLARSRTGKPDWMASQPASQPTERPATGSASIASLTLVKLGEATILFHSAARTDSARLESSRLAPSPREPAIIIKIPL